jgi:hypothetical protein
MNTTLIFAKKRDYNSNFKGYITRFIKQGDFADAISYFDDKFPAIYDEEKKIYKWCTGGVIVTDDELKKSPCQVAAVNDGDTDGYWTSDVSNLSNEELLAIHRDGTWLAEDVFEKNGKTKEEYHVAAYFDHIHELLDFEDGKYIDFYYEVTDEPKDNDEDFFHYNNKYVTKIK